MEKFCKDCGQTKPIAEFHNNKTEPDGHSFYCKPCTLARMKRPKTKPPKVKAPEGMKHCTRCVQTKPLSEFSRSSTTWDGYYNRCKDCSYEVHNAWRLNNLKKAAADQKRWRDEHPERFKDIGRKRRYGIPHGWYAETLATQNGKCAACGVLQTEGKGTFHIDHCHVTNKVRALLCHNCNLAVGHLHNDPEIAEAVKQYLLKHSPSKERGI